MYSVSQILSRYQLLLPVENLLHLLKSARKEISELCNYSMNVQKVVAIIKQLIACQTVQVSMGTLREFDAINYIHYASRFVLGEDSGSGDTSPHTTSNFVWGILL